MTDKDKFRIEIVDQHWWDAEPGQPSDLCSHGKIILEINGIRVSDQRDDVEWTINTSALMMMRTLKGNHTRSGIFPIFQHCGQLLMIGCPICIDWDVVHEDQHIRVENVEKNLITNPTSRKRYPECNIIVEERHYREQVLTYANEAAKFCKARTSVFCDSESKDEYDQFWEEFDKLFHELSSSPA